MGIIDKTLISATTTGVFTLAEGRLPPKVILERSLDRLLIDAIISRAAQVLEKPEEIIASVSSAVMLQAIINRCLHNVDWQEFNNSINLDKAVDEVVARMEKI